MKILSKKRLVVIIIMICVIMVLCSSFILNGVSSIKEIFICNEALERTYYLMQIVCSVVVIVGGIIGVWQYVLGKRAELIHYHNGRIQKAIDLSEYYKDNILCNMIIIKHVYDKSGILSILNSIKRENIERFDVRELNNNLSDQEKNNIRKILKSPEFVNIIVESASIYSDNTTLTKQVYVKEGEKIIEVTKANGNKIIDYFSNTLVCGTLNNLEFFAMHFNYEIADKKTVYQSLHQTYLEIVQMLYYDISVNNETAEQKLYTNVIELYGTWTKMAEKQMYEEADRSSTAIVKGAKAKSIE